MAKKPKDPAPPGEPPEDPPQPKKRGRPRKPPPAAPDGLTPIDRLTRDLTNAARTLSAHEARFLVDAYYQMQQDRIRAHHQLRTLSGAGEPHEVMVWLADQREALEGQVRRALDQYSGNDIVGRWMRSQLGIGPVIAAGLLANIDITKAPDAGNIWSYAGLDPSTEWEKNTKRPWNGSLKRLCFLIGESFVKVSGNEESLYGEIYRKRKEYETGKNEAGDYADQAAESLTVKRYGDDTQAKGHYLAGKLPPARIHLRAKRYAVKMFLSHLHTVWTVVATGKAPRRPWIMSHPPHNQYIPPPNWPMVER